MYGAKLDNIVLDLSLKPSPAMTERFNAMFMSLLTNLKTHGVSGTISIAAVKSTTSLTKTSLRQVSYEHHKRPERNLARGGGIDGGGGGDVRG